MPGEQPTIQAAKFTPVQTVVTATESLLTSAYTKITPAPLDKALRANKLVASGCQVVSKTRKYADSLIARVDRAADGACVVVLDTVSNFRKSVKDFYSSENNDYARIILRFLTLAIPNPQLLAGLTLEKFAELFRYDPQHGSERFTKILGSFYKQAKEHWLVDKTSKPLEIVRNSLYLVAFTMEELHIPYSDRVPFFAQKLSDYFMVENPPANLFKRKPFRSHFGALLQVPSLSEAQQLLSDQFLQIASVLGFLSATHTNTTDVVVVLTVPLALALGWAGSATHRLAIVSLRFWVFCHAGGGLVRRGRELPNCSIVSFGRVASCKPGSGGFSKCTSRPELTLPVRSSAARDLGGSFRHRPCSV